MKKIKLEVGQIWQVPKTLDVRTIESLHNKETNYPVDCNTVRFIDIGSYFLRVSVKSFKAWITKKNAKLIGHYDFEKKKARAVKT